MKDLSKRRKRTRAFPPAQAVQLRRALEARRAQLLRAHEELQEQASEAEPESGDIADVAEGVIEDRDRAALDEHDRALLEEIEHALAKFDAGTYGLSEKSGRPIPFERLLAVPWARYDSEEAERIEHDAR
jgi:DnaK suppressor protein